MVWTWMLKKPKTWKINKMERKRGRAGREACKSWLNKPIMIMPSDASF